MAVVVVAIGVRPRAVLVLIQLNSILLYPCKHPPSRLQRRTTHQKVFSISLQVDIAAICPAPNRSPCLPQDSPPSQTISSLTAITSSTHLQALHGNVRCRICLHPSKSTRAHGNMTQQRPSATQIMDVAIKDRTMLAWLKTAATHGLPLTDFGTLQIAYAAEKKHGDLPPWA